MRAPTSHIINATPTLPDDLNILLGVAYILINYLLDDSGIDSPSTYPVPITQLKIRKDALKRPATNVRLICLHGCRVSDLVVAWFWVHYHILLRAVLFCVRLGKTRECSPHLDHLLRIYAEPRLLRVIYFRRSIAGYALEDPTWFLDSRVANSVGRSMVNDQYPMFEVNNQDHDKSPSMNFPPVTARVRSIWRDQDTAR
jgi:hypothetical protein